MNTARMDQWGVGSYEVTAQELEPASEAALAALGPVDGDQVLDLACGTGNAAALAVAQGARVTGLDSSQRLLEVARERVPDGEFVHGDMGELPFTDGAFDAAVSVFGIIFARPSEPAVAELARVVRPGGRVAITSWPPRGAVFEAVKLMRQAVGRVRPPEGGPQAAAWGDPEVVRGLLSPYGEVEVSERELPDHGKPPEEMWDRWARTHPMWVGARPHLEEAGEWEGLREQTLAALHEARQGGDTTTPYLLSVLRRA